MHETSSVGRVCADLIVIMYAINIMRYYEFMSAFVISHSWELGIKIIYIETD